MSLSRPARGRRGRRGRISYAQLGINQLGAVYEALLSYRGFFAEEDLYEVKKAGDAPDDLFNHAPTRVAPPGSADAGGQATTAEANAEESVDPRGHPRGLVNFNQGTANYGENETACSVTNPVHQCFQDLSYALRKSLRDMPD